MPDSKTVETHYTRDGLLNAITAGLGSLGLTPETVNVHDLAPVDEFHIGGRLATESFLDQLVLREGDNVLDVGCGLGGASRFAADKYGCRMTGVDLTQTFVDVGETLNTWVGLADRVTLAQGNATELSFTDATFDKAFLLHVGMNIADKAALARALFRVIKPGGRLGIYDIMRIGDGALTYPVPWATEAEGSAVSTAEEYRSVLESAGFLVISQRNRRDFALEFFARQKAAAAKAKQPPALGLHIVMGETAAVKIGNLVDNITRNCLAPFEMIAERPDTA